ncbi:hypothetical protein B0J13DRAFT_522675 [Dactylonectria estremocensis]|uniref:Uncharacterized protein n=1 Tax=Dactylonectria estremocensis TaxID=1079267 RepID=A0A9P9JAE9_9HYPO|nr:hypothetical protein B0J13DRAFT_522675 [Dactylonectria estremocensis]
MDGVAKEEQHTPPIRTWIENVADVTVIHRLPVDSWGEKRRRSTSRRQDKAVTKPVPLVSHGSCMAMSETASREVGFLGRHRCVSPRRDVLPKMAGTCYELERRTVSGVGRTVRAMMAHPKVSLACWACVSRGRLNNSVVVQTLAGTSKDHAPKPRSSMWLQCQGHGLARTTSSGFRGEDRWIVVPGLVLALGPPRVPDPNCQVHSETAPWVGRALSRAIRKLGRTPTRQTSRNITINLGDSSQQASCNSRPSAHPRKISNGRGERDESVSMTCACIRDGNSTMPFLAVCSKKCPNPAGEKPCLFP